MADTRRVERAAAAATATRPIAVTWAPSERYMCTTQRNRNRVRVRVLAPRQITTREGRTCVSCSTLCVKCTLFNVALLHIVYWRAPTTVSLHCYSQTAIKYYYSIVFIIIFFDYVIYIIGVIELILLC